jgi:RNA polymerase sigma factor (sigma-70 family)
VIVVNLARSAQRRRSLARRHAAADPTAKGEVDDGAEERADREAVLVALRRIARRQRECLVLRYYLDLSEADIAGVLGVSAGSVKTHTSRGLAAMARLLGEGR